MAIFEWDQSSAAWTPDPIAAGPFQGMQGGAIAGLLVGQMEAKGATEGWGDAVALSVWFLKLTPVGAVRTKLDILKTSSRVSLIDNALTPAGSHEPVGGWIGIRAATEWLPSSGPGFGRGVLLDMSGEIGAVSMSVALTLFPTPSRRPES